MPFDGILTQQIANELDQTLSGGKVRKIYQPENDEIRLNINKNRENFLLLISANPNNNRIHLTQTTKENPDVPPTFCMTLRKHLTNSEILSIEQNDSDRVICINFKSINDFGEPTVKKLICEITGRNSNIILAMEEEDKITILDSIKKVGFGKSRFRQILPGKEYTAPPSENKLNFKEFDHSMFINELQDSPKNAEKFFVSRFLGISPAFIREICFRAKIDPSTPLRELSEGERKRLSSAFLYQLDHLEAQNPKIFLNKNNLIDFYGLNLKHLGSDFKEYPSYSEMLEDFYYLRDKRAHFKVKSSNLKHQLDSLFKNKAKKLQNLDRDYKNSLNNEKNKLYGDLITANIYQLERGMKEAELYNYLSDPPEYIKVPLKVNETPSQNAQRFYKKYNKNKRAQDNLEKQIEKTKQELEYIESLLTTLNTSTEINELDEIRFEFNSSDLINKKSSKGNKRPKPSKPMHFVSSEGFDIYVGKNNFQNDYISTKLGKDEDCWLHVKDAPGSHVLIVADNKFIPEQTVLEGGMLAAYYSKLKQSENVPVDYMEFKYVKKPKKAKPGMVIFTDHNTMYITPDIDHIKSLEMKNADAL